jgi:inner membrane transporter RhtA
MAHGATYRQAAASRPQLADRLPPHAYFLGSAVFHYLGPAFAVLLFARVAPLGVAWLRIASAAVVFALWRRPWRPFVAGSWPRIRVLLALGVVLATMNACFYLAIARLPLGTVGAIEFLGQILLALAGLRTRRNLAALALAVGGVWLLTDVRLVAQPVGFAFAFANCALFILYVVLGHRIANEPPAAGAAGGRRETGIDRLGAAMLVALVAITPLGLAGAAPAVGQPRLLLAGVGVGVCSSVIPYVCDQLAMARLSRATFALLLALLPASAALIGVVVLRQIPSPVEVAGIALVVCGVALHQESRESGAARRPPSTPTNAPRGARDGSACAGS